MMHRLKLVEVETTYKYECFTTYIHLFLFHFFIFYLTHILLTTTMHKTASLADEGNSAYKPMEISIKTNFLLTRTMP